MLCFRYDFFWQVPSQSLLWVQICVYSYNGYIGIDRACVSSKLPSKLVFQNFASRYTAFKTLKVLTDV